MYKRLIKFIEKNKILTKHQYGFRANRFTELAIIELTDRITKAIDNGEYTIGIQLFQLRLSTSKAKKSNTSAKGCWESL